MEMAQDEHGLGRRTRESSCLVDGLLRLEENCVVVVTPDETDCEAVAAEEICSLYYVDGDPTEGHRSQHASLYVDHGATGFELDTVDGGRIEVSQQFDHLRLAGVTGCVVWNGAVVLAKSLNHWERLGVFRLVGQRILELGAGTGMLALAAAMLGANVIATEQGERLKLLRRNIEQHSTADGYPWPIGQRGGSVEVRELDWFIPGHNVECDLILATDVVYTEEVTAALVQCLTSYDVPAVVTVELRTEEVHHAFIEALARAKYTVHRLNAAMHAEDVRTKRVVTYVLTRPEQR